MRRLDRDRAIEFRNISPEDAACPLPRGDLMAQLHASEDGRMLSGAAAFAAMWRVIPLLRPLGLLARWPPALRALQGLYEAFLAVRPGLQRVARMFDRS